MFTSDVSSNFFTVHRQTIWCEKNKAIADITLPHSALVQWCPREPVWVCRNVKSVLTPMSHFELHPILHRPLNLKFITCCNAARKDKATVKGICRENLAKSGYVVLEICSGKLYMFQYCLYHSVYCKYIVYATKMDSMWCMWVDIPYICGLYFMRCWQHIIWRTQRFLHLTSTSTIIIRASVQNSNTIAKNFNNKYC